MIKDKIKVDRRDDDVSMADDDGMGTRSDLITGIPDAPEAG